jgi:UDP-N-acetyl-D-galactosamine dehydrogenase
VLEAARTKWNFLPFEPGLVGGHCIGVDPYYLAHLARELAMNRASSLPGARPMTEWAPGSQTGLHERLGNKAAGCWCSASPSRRMCRTFATAGVIDVVRRLPVARHEVLVADPLADPSEATNEYGLELVDPQALDCKVDLVLGAVAHAQYKEWSEKQVGALLKEGGQVADLKRLWKWAQRSTRGAWTL